MDKLQAKDTASAQEMRDGFTKLDDAGSDADFCDPGKRESMVQGYSWAKPKSRYSGDVGGFLERNNVRDRGAGQSPDEPYNTNGPVPYYDED